MNGTERNGNPVGENYLCKHDAGNGWYYFPKMTRSEGLLLKCWDTHGESNRRRLHLRGCLLLCAQADRLLGWGAPAPRAHAPTLPGSLPVRRPRVANDSTSPSKLASNPHSSSRTLCLPTEPRRVGCVFPSCPYVAGAFFAKEGTTPVPATFSYHSAFEVEAPDTAPPRRSIEVRTMAFLPDP